MGWVRQIDFETGPATRDAFFETLADLGKDHKRTVVVDASFDHPAEHPSLPKTFQERYFRIGPQGPNAVGMASGLAYTGLIPFVYGPAGILVDRGFDLIRSSIGQPGLNVNVVAVDGGIQSQVPGACGLHSGDLALISSIPGFVVLVPADGWSAGTLASQLPDVYRPCYMRTSSCNTPVVYEENTNLQIGEAHILRHGSDVTIVALGALVSEALQAADELSKTGVESEVIDCHTVKPLDVETILGSVDKTGHLVVAEEHQSWGGLCSNLCRQLSQYCTLPVESVALDDTFAESGKRNELLEVYGLTAPHVEEAVKSVLSKKDFSTR